MYFCDLSALGLDYPQFTSIFLLQRLHSYEKNWHMNSFATVFPSKLDWNSRNGFGYI
jgi:hypothetical protein